MKGGPGGWFAQDLPDEFPDHDAAVRDCTAITDPQLVARLAGELRELLALGLEESDYRLADGPSGFKADYGPGPAAD